MRQAMVSGTLYIYITLIASPWVPRRTHEIQNRMTDPTTGYDYDWVTKRAAQIYCSPGESRNSRDWFGGTTCPSSGHCHHEALQWLSDYRGTTCSSQSTYPGHGGLTRELLSSEAFGRPRNALTTCSLLKPCDGIIVMIYPLAYSRTCDEDMLQNSTLDLHEQEDSLH